MSRPGCASCAFWKRDWDGAVTGQCRLRAPVVLVVPRREYDDEPVSHIETWWPETDETDWCGERWPLGAEVGDE